MLASRQSQSAGTRTGSNRSTAALRSNRFNRLMKQLCSGRSTGLNYLNLFNDWNDWNCWNVWNGLQLQ